jgi:hypothetical protein
MFIVSLYMSLASLMFVCKAWSLPKSEVHQAPDLLASFRLGRKGSPGTNTLAYCHYSEITAVKVL